MPIVLQRNLHISTAAARLRTLAETDEPTNPPLDSKMSDPNAFATKDIISLALLGSAVLVLVFALYMFIREARERQKPSAENASTPTMTQEDGPAPDHESTSRGEVQDVESQCETSRGGNRTQAQSIKRVRDVPNTSSFQWSEGLRSCHTFPMDHIPTHPFYASNVEAQHKLGTSIEKNKELWRDSGDLPDSAHDVLVLDMSHLVDLSQSSSLSLFIETTGSESDSQEEEDHIISSRPLCQAPRMSPVILISNSNSDLSSSSKKSTGSGRISSKHRRTKAFHSMSNLLLDDEHMPTRIEKPTSTTSSSSPVSFLSTSNSSIVSRDSLGDSERVVTRRASHLTPREIILLGRMYEKLSIPTQSRTPRALPTQLLAIEPLMTQSLQNLQIAPLNQDIDAEGSDDSSSHPSSALEGPHDVYFVPLESSPMMGMELQDGTTHPVVSTLPPTSPLAQRISVGDVLLSVNNVSMADQSASQARHMIIYGAFESSDEDKASTANQATVFHQRLVKLTISNPETMSADPNPVSYRFGSRLRSVSSSGTV